MLMLCNRLRSMYASPVMAFVIRDETALKGNWSFDLTYSIGTGPEAAQSRRITIFEAIEQQLGLKLEQRGASAPVLVIDSANEEPIPNRPDIDSLLPPLRYPTEFEVLSVKPAPPDADPRSARTEIVEGGRVTYRNTPLRMLFFGAFPGLTRLQMQGVPEASLADRYDVAAKVALPPEISPQSPALSAVLARRILEERFGLKYHTEPRSVTAYRLTAGKPKLTKSDSDGRAHCGEPAAPAGSPPGTRLLGCRHVSVRQFAILLKGMTPELPWPVEDATSLDGPFDFTLTYNVNATFHLTTAAPTGAEAADPTGGYTLGEALEKQLGLKLEKVKRTENIIVIDHIDAKPSEN
jgi:uncharacterized protein (TIGR03435 family)